MNILSILQLLLPIVLSKSHPQAQEAHAVLADAHAEAASPIPNSDKRVEMLERVLDLCLRARAISSAPADATTDALAQALAAAATHH